MVRHRRQRKKTKKTYVHQSGLDALCESVLTGLGNGTAWFVPRAFRVLLTFIVVIGMVSFTSSAPTALAYYTDKETTLDNEFVATALDFILDSGAWTPHQDVSDLEPGETITRTIRLLDEIPKGSTPFRYFIYSDNIVGDEQFCSLLDLQVMQGDLIVYTGPIGGFSSGPHLFPYQNLWTFDLSLPDEIDRLIHEDCSFGISVDGWQETFPTYPQGYNDEESTQNSIQSYTRECTIIDFETDAIGTSIQLGQLIDTEYEQWGLLISGVNNNPDHPHQAVVFDSGTPTSGDTDLGTPHADFGGPGEGVGGAQNAPGENSTAQENVLIIPENGVDTGQDGFIDNPDDELLGGTLIFEFTEATWVNTIRVLDVDKDGALITLFMNNDENDTATIPIPNLGENSLQLLTLDTSNVHKMHVDFVASGAVDDLCFEAIRGATDGQSSSEDSPDNRGRNYPHIALNEVLANPIGPDGAEGLLGEWIEIYNSGPQSVNLNEWYIEDGSPTGNRQTITSSNTHTGSTEIGPVGDVPDEWLVIFMNGEILDNTSDTITLYTNTGREIDSYSYDAGEAGVPENKSDARVPDGTGDWVDPTPTPGGPNVPEDIGTGEVLGEFVHTQQAGDGSTLDVQIEVQSDSEDEETNQNEPLDYTKTGESDNPEYREDKSDEPEDGGTEQNEGQAHNSDEHQESGEDSQEITTDNDLSDDHETAIINNDVEEGAGDSALDVKENPAVDQTFTSSEDKDDPIQIHAVSTDTSDEPPVDTPGSDTGNDQLLNREEDQNEAVGDNSEDK